MLYWLSHVPQQLHLILAWSRIPLRIRALIVYIFELFQKFLKMFVYLLKNIQCRAWTHDSEINSHMFFRLSQPGALRAVVNSWSMAFCLAVCGHWGGGVGLPIALGKGMGDVNLKFQAALYVAMHFSEGRVHTFHQIHQSTQIVWVLNDPEGCKSIILE